MKRTVLQACLVLSCTIAAAQQEVMISQYMFNGLFLNPAYAGTHGHFSSSLLHRTQWVNVEGAPVTSMAAMDAPLLNERMGVGLSIVHDRIGVSRDLDISGSYAYHLKVSGTGRLSFGLRAGLSLYSARLSELVHWDADDPVYQQDIANKAVAKFGAGLYYSTDRAFVGLSVPTMHAADGAIRTVTTQGRFFTEHVYLTAGQVFPLNEYLDIKPSFLVKYEGAAPLQLDLNCSLLYKERLWLGAGYRSGAALVAMVEYRISPKLRTGYAYDMSTSRVRTYANGGHEIMLGFDLGGDPVKIKSPRYF